VYDDSTYLPLTGNNAGDQAFATDTDILYIWDGLAWQQAGASNSDDLTEGSTNLFFTNARADARITASDTDALSEGTTNLYYTDARADARITASDTDALSEGSTNLYYTDARADARITAATTTDLSEGTNLYYTDARADARAALLVDSAPATLDTLNELAAALGDDPNFATTVTNSIALKAPLASPTFTGNVTADGAVIDGGTGYGTLEIGGVSGAYIDLKAPNSDDFDLRVVSHGSGGDIESGGTGNIGFKTNGSTKVTVEGSTGNIRIGTTNTSVFNGVGGNSKLVVKGSDSSTNILNNSNASITIANDDGTASNTSALHFARADTDDNPHYAGASIVAQFVETQVTGQYPKGELAFLTSTASNTAPSEKMRIDSAGNVGIGTESPSTKLEVNGTVTATAFAGDGSALSGVGFTGFPTNATDLASPSEGDAYYNTTDDVVKFYTGSSWIPLTGTINRYDYTATANQTTFAAVYSGSNVDVYLNGIKLVVATDYTASNGTSVVMTSGVEVGDLVNIVAQTSSFSAPPASVPATGGTFTGDVILSGATTNLTVGNTVESSNLRLTNNGDLTLAGSGHAFQIGATSGPNLAMDNNEIMSRNNGVGAELHLNPDGGDVTINNQGSLSSGSKLVVRNRIELGDATNATTKPTALLHIHKDINTGNPVTLAEAPSIVLSENEVAGAGNQGYHGAYWFGSQDTNTPADFNWYVAGMASQSGGGDTGPATSAGNLEFYTTPLDTGTPTKSMELSINGNLSVSSGSFSAPGQPAFEMVKYTDTVGTASANNYLRAFDSITFQTGNTSGTGASTSTGKYTAPSDGLYHFSVTMTWDSGDGGDDSFGIGFVIANNSANYNYDKTNNDGFRMNPRWETTPGQEMMVTISKTCKLAAGATIGLWMRDVDFATINLQHAEFGGYKFA
jgi:hypothetical protein